METKNNQIKDVESVNKADGAEIKSVEKPTLDLGKVNLVVTAPNYQEMEKLWYRGNVPVQGEENPIYLKIKSVNADRTRIELELLK